MASQVSAIIPVRNRPGFLLEAVESLIATAYPNLEILIVDDGSEDETLNCAGELERRFPAIVRTVQHGDGRNHGPGASRNLGVRAVGGKYVCFLDSDDVVLPHRFERAVRLLENDESIDAVCEPFLTDDGQRPYDVEPEKRPGLTRLGSGGRWNTDTVLLRRRCFLDVGGFSERLRTCEDLVLWGKLILSSRIEESGTEPVAIYRRHGKNTDVILENSLGAHLEVMRWAKKRDLDDGRREALLEIVWGKMLYVSDRLRRDGRPLQAMRMLLATVMAHPAYATRTGFWKNLVWGGVEKGTGLRKPW
ncbi:MAG TPA: glycosyltransferase family A protein [Gemmatimonadota bacterium]|nr:glycosyltransferase family A protein [Gemmatimonadota bacterium]